MKRTILSLETNVVKVNNAFEVKVTTVVWAIVTETKARTMKVEHIAVSTYINRKVDFYGVSARFFNKKPISINIKNPLESKSLIDNNRIQYMKQESFQDAVKKYMGSLKNLKGTVEYFNKSDGVGIINIPSIGCKFTVYACNLKGKKTWYAETACTYLNEGEVMVDSLEEIDRGLTPMISQGVQFDAEKWASLDHSKLAFTCDDNGKPTSGLLA